MKDLYLKTYTLLSSSQYEFGLIYVNFAAEKWDSREWREQTLEFSLMENWFALTTSGTIWIAQVLTTSHLMDTSQQKQLEFQNS